MKLKTIVLSMVTFLILGTGSVFAQKTKILKGKLDALSGVKTLDIEYDYDGMTVGKYNDEAKYIKDGIAKRDDKEPGSGEKWAKAWVSDRQDRFQPKFETLLNETLEKAGVSASVGDDDATIKLIVQTVFTEPGWNIGITKRAAEITLNYIFIDKKTDKQLLKMEMSRIPGSTAFGMDFDTGMRLAEAYAKGGKELGKYLSKKAFK